jgi:very-short-patch-repair endonuclease
MSKNRIHKYNPRLKVLARQLRQNSTLAEVILWLNIKKEALSYEFHRQVPINEYIVDFYCHELELAIEIDGYTHDYNYEKDIKRQKVLEALGIRVVRFTEEDVKKHLNDVIRVLLATIEEIESGHDTSF